MKLKSGERWRRGEKEKGRRRIGRRGEGEKG
jgi:hypothetical protein